MDEISSRAVQRTGHVAAVYEGCLYLWGGYKQCENESHERYLPGKDLWKYDPLYEQWFYHECGGDIPAGTSGAAAVIVGSDLYCFGGFREGGNTSDLYRLNMTSFVWHLVAVEGPQPIPSDKMVGWAFNDRLYFFGGFGPRPDTYPERPKDFAYVVDNHTPHHYRRGWNNQLVCFGISEQRWTIPRYKGKAPSARAAHACARVGGQVYVMGGRHLDTRLNDLYCFNMESQEWSQSLVTSGGRPVERSWHSLTALDEDYLLLYGGFSQGEVPLSDSWLLHLSSLTWQRLDFPSNRPRLWHTASLIAPGEVVVCGGCSENILNYQTTHIHALEALVLRFCPRSLFRLCLETTIHWQPLLRADWTALPSNLQSVLFVRSSRISAHATTTLEGS